MTKAARAPDSTSPPENLSLRIVAIRVLVGLYALVWSLSQAPVMWRMAQFEANRFVPAGVLALLSAPPDAWAVRVGLVLLVLLAAAFVCGVRLRLTGPAFALGLLTAASFRHSWGHMGHGDNLMVLQVGVLGLWATGLLSKAPPGGPSKEAAKEAAARDALRLIMWVTVLTYFVAGVAKLRIGGAHWFDGTILADQIARDAATKMALGAAVSPFVEAWLRQPALHAPLAIATFALELGAPLAMLPLWGGRLRATWIVGLWAMHAGILAVMAIGFVYPLSGIAFAAFFAVERPYSRLIAALPTRWQTRLS